MSEQNNSLEMAVNSLATEMRRNSYIQAITGMSGNTKRPMLYQEFGYPQQIDFNDFYRIYRRNAAGFAVVHRLLDGCWQDLPVIVEGEEANESRETTPWEKNVTRLMKKHWAKVKDADRRNMVGRYSALLIQVRDNQAWSKPINTALVKSLKDKALVKLIPVWEQQLTVAEWDNDRLSDTFGQPLMFNFNEMPVGDNKFIGPVRGEPVHPSRVIIFCEGAEDESALSGIPLLESGYNKLLDLEKISGGGAEGFLKNASRTLVNKFSKDSDMAAMDKRAKEQGYADLGEAIEDKFRRLNRGTDAAAVTQDGDISVLSVTPGDPAPTWTVTANELAASVQIPFTILFGQQTGRLASDEDKTDWAIRRNGRRNGFLTDRITELLTRFWQIGIIEPPSGEEITVSWADLLAPGEKEKIANMKDMATVAKDTQQAYGTPAFTEDEIREVGGYDPLPEAEKPKGADESAKNIDPLTGKPIEQSTEAGKSDNTAQQS